MTLEKWIAAAREQRLPPLLLIAGDAPLATPLAERFAAQLGELWNVAPRQERFAADLPAAIDDLRTMSMFEGGKILVVHSTGLLADREEAAELMKPVVDAAKRAGDAVELEGAAREAAVGLLRVLRLHDLDPRGGPPEQVVAALPPAILGDASAERRAQLAGLLEAALLAGLRGAGADDLTLLSDLLRDGLPERHVLILVERSVDPKHPLAAALARREAIVEAGRLALQKRGVDGLEALLGEMERETGVRARPDAARELVRRTLRGEDARRGGEAGAVDADSAARFAAEYRKLAALAGERGIDRALVVENVADRGEEEIFAVLDAIGDGEGAAAMARIARRLAGAEDPILERLSIFALLANFARQLVAVAGAMRATGARAGETSYPKFRERLAPKLQGAIDGIDVNPLRGLHAFRLHRVYLAASRLGGADLASLPARTLETERRLKGDSAEPDAALAAYVAALAGGGVSSDPLAASGSRTRAAGVGRS